MPRDPQGEVERLTAWLRVIAEDEQGELHPPDVAWKALNGEPAPTADSHG